MRVRIASIASVVPDAVVVNEDYQQFVDTSNEWIVERTGIRERRILPHDEQCSDLGARAALLALERAGVEPADVDAIVCATSTPDTIFPCTGSVIQGKIGAKRACAMDVSAGCPGFLHGLVVAEGLLSVGRGCKNVLLVAAEALTRYTDYYERSTCILFGDAAGACLLQRSDDDSGILSSYLRSDGTLGDLLVIPAGGTAKPVSEEAVEGRLGTLKMAGREVFRRAVIKMKDAALTALERADVSPEQLDWLVPHQANLRIIRATQKRLGLSNDKVYVNIDRYGNTSAATIPLALDEMERRGLLKRGQLLLMVSFGAGFLWGGTVVRW